MAFNGHAKKLVVLITSVFVLVGMLFTAAWTLDSRVEGKVDNRILTVKTSFENQLQQFEIQTTGAMKQFQRAQDIRYYQAKLEYYSYLLHRVDIELSRCGPCPNRPNLITERNYLIEKIRYYERELDRVMTDGN